MAMTAACSKVMFAGLGTSLSSRADTCSVKDPLPMPKTSSPTADLVTSAPIAATVPATSNPGTGLFGLRNPKYSRPR